MPRYTSTHTGAQIDAAVTAVAGKQDALTPQTAYTGAGGKNAIPSVSTNSLGQVTDITLINLAQDLASSSAVVTISAANWATLKEDHYISTTPTLSELEANYELIKIKASINGNDYTLILFKNAANKYSGLFFIEESTHLYEISAYYNGNNLILRCATVY